MFNSVVFHHWMKLGVNNSARTAPDTISRGRSSGRGLKTQQTDMIG